MKYPVLLYIPNMIGYIRLLLLFIFPLYAFSSPLIATAIYFNSAILDAFDGLLARRLHQQSYFGAILDYTIDRVSVALLLIVLALLYPQIWIFFALILCLDLASHIYHIYSNLFLKRAHHKQVNQTQGKLLNLYYTSRPVLFFTCFFHDGWLLFLYLYNFYPTQPVVWFLGLICLPGFIFKTFIHIIQIQASIRAVIELDK
jgi:CDP-diacylglycerol--inositol 3-phosphatidyltransferase